MGNCIGKKENHQKAETLEKSNTLSNEKEPEIDFESEFNVMWQDFGDETKIHDDSLRLFFDKIEIKKDSAEEFLTTYILKCQTLAVITQPELFEYCKLNELNSWDALANSIQEKIREYSEDKKHMRLFFKYIFEKSSDYPKVIETKLAIPILEILIELFPWSLANRFLVYLKMYRKSEHLKIDEWEHIPVFLIEHKDGLHDYNEEDSAFPRLFDEFVKSMSSTFIRVLTHE
ncbi:unnamed protein product [Blepharisma stoltei]|uniref:Defective in cullin neddylation protein n=1 Tax=Blepharisma stoltei TaxID=1481888 RepID=A0AAU9J498_9CILI|nr:unnamed protein product [Blepharisma stoltei]